MIEFDAVSKRYGDNTVLDRLSLRIERGELFVLIGASGSGKSTLLRMINRLVEPETGAVRIDGQDVRAMAPTALRQGIGYVIQSTGLFPHWTVAQNIGTLPRLLGWPRERTQLRVAEMLNLLQLDETLAGRYPASLSGGQQQRVGVARALAGDPPIVLMDEPFGALDPVTRESLQTSLKAIQHDTGKTIVFVTHDMDEALRLGDRMALIGDGQLRQCGTGLELLEHPADRGVAEFVGGGASALRALGVRRVRDVMQAPACAELAPVDPDASLQEALGLMLTLRVDQLQVQQGDTRLGLLQLTDLLKKPA